MADILFDRQDGIATVTLNRPEARNALTGDMSLAFIDFLQSIERDPAIRCVLLKGAGEHFMAGGDVKSFAEVSGLSGEERRAMFERRVQAVSPLLLLIERIPQIVVAAARGAVAGAGVSFVAAADLAIAARSAFFLVAHVKIAVTPDGGASYYLPRDLGVKRAKELALLGDRIDAEQAERWGLVNRAVDDVDLDSTVESITRRLAASPRAALAGAKRLMNQSLSNSLPAQLQREAEEFSRSAAEPDFVEGLRAFAEKRQPRFGQ